MQAEKNTGKFTFGNILLVLLVIGTFVVGGLMYKLYQQLTETPEKTANWHEEQKSQQIEVMSPDGKPGTQVFRPAGASAPHTPAATPAPTVQQPAGEPPSAVNNDVLTAETIEPVQRKNTPKKATAPADDVAERPIRPEPQNNNAPQGELPLHPTNVARQPAEPREQILKPQPANNQKNKSGDAIDELF